MSQPEFSRKTINVAQRRAHNRDLAIRLAAQGVAIFPSSGKTPLIPGWTALDSALTDDERAAVVARHQEQHGDTPAHVGATTDEATIRKLWRAFPDAVPSISCGANGLLVLDADTKRDGPRQLIAWAERAGVDLSQFPMTRTQSGGLHVYMLNSQDGPLGNAVGGFFDLGVDVRGAGGQCVAPGSIREDGKVYAQEDGTPSLADEILLGTIPPIPDVVRNMIGSRAKSKQHISAADEATAIERLATQDWPDFADMTDSTIGKFDLDALAEKDEEFAQALVNPSEDRSTARWTLAKCLHREYGDKLDVLDFAALLEHFNDELDGAFGVFVGDDKPNEGEFSLRSIARDFLRSKNDRRVSDGAAFGVVEDEAGNDNAPPEYVEAKEAETKLAKAAQAPLRFSGEMAANWKPTRWLVRNLLPETGIAMLVGDANIGKTFLSLDLANRLDRGMSFDDDYRIREDVGVMYICGEGANSIDGRLRAWDLHHELSGGRVLIEDDIDLFGDGTPDTTRVQAAASKTFEERLKRYKEATGRAIKVVVIDTLSSVSPGLDENLNANVKYAFGILRRLERKHGLLFIVVHHSGLSSKDRARGASAFRGNADTILLLSDDKKQLVLRADKQREGRKGAALRFRLRTIDIGEDQDGLPVTSCAVEHEAELRKKDAPNMAVEDQEDAADLGAPQSEPQGPAAQPDDGANLSERQRRVLDIAQEMGRPFTARDIHGAYNKAWGRKNDRPVSEDAIRRTLETLRGAFLDYQEHPNRRDNRWTLINQEGQQLDLAGDRSP